MKFDRKPEDRFIYIRVEGEAVGQSRISIDHLVHLLTHFNKAIFGTGRILSGETESIHRGQKPKKLIESLSLDLVGITHGSPSTVLHLERSAKQLGLPLIDFGNQVYKKALEGLDNLQTNPKELPEGFDRGVVLAWRDVGLLLEKGISNINFQMNSRKKPICVTISPDGFSNLQQFIPEPGLNLRSIEGRLLMADFKEHGTRCRVHPSVGDPVFCLFEEDLQDEIYENIRHYVKVTGEAVEDPITDKIKSIRIINIQRLEGKEDIDTDLLPKGTPIPEDFWTSPSIEELARAQSVLPLKDVNKLFGTWPDSPDDSFEATISTLRKASVED